MDFGLWLFAVSGHENGVGEAVLAAVRVDERKIRRLEVVRAPADGHGVEGDDESRVAIFLGPAQDRQRDIVAVRPEEQWVLGSHDERGNLPVELIPPVSIPKNFGHFFHRSSSGSAQDDGNLEVLRSSCGSKFSLGVEDTLHPNRGQEYRRLELVAEEGCLGTKFRHSNRNSEGNWLVPPNCGQWSLATCGE